MSDPNNLRLNRARAAFDTRHRFVYSFLWELPGGQSIRGPAGVLLKGWQINGIGTLSTGTPFSVTEPIDIALNGSTNRPDLIGNPNKGPKTVEQWFEVSAFRRLNPVSDAGRNGTAGRNIVTGPGIHNWDMAFLKNNRIGNDDRLTIQFRAEFFNIFNNANFHLPQSTIGSPAFGRIQNANDGRIIQLGLKLDF